jgi:hypothetical protein
MKTTRLSLAEPLMKVRGVRADLRKASQFGVFEKKSNAFKVAREVLPPPPMEEQHMSRKLREFIQRQEALAQGKRPPQKQSRAPGPQKSAPQPIAAPVPRVVANQPSGQEAGGEQRKRKKYESRKVREKRARREEVRQKAQEQDDVSRPAFGEVADAPPSLTLKVKRGQAPAGGASTGNRLSRLFEQQMKRAVAGAHRQAPVGPLQRREAQSREELRQSVISQYRELRGTNAAATLTGQRPAA